MTAIMRRRARRNYLARIVHVHDEETQKKVLAQAFNSPPDEDWARASARVAVYSTPAIRAAMEQANKAAAQVDIRKMYYDMLQASTTRGLPGGTTAEKIMTAFNAIVATAEEANTADDLIERLMQVDLELRPSARLRAALEHAAAAERGTAAWQLMQQDPPRTEHQVAH
jgi:hypothetical protein